MPQLADALIYYVVFLFSTTLHEAAHAWAAQRGGDPTAYLGGQVSLDPRPHIRREPFGMVILPILTALVSGWPFGFASAPYDPQWAQRYPRRAALMALAGPAANLLLVLIAAGCLRLGAASGLFFAPDSVRFGHLAGTEAAGLWPGIAFFLSVVFSLNLLLAAFNLLPLPPLDGSGAMPLLLTERASRRYQEFLWGSPGVSWLGILVAWQVFDFVFDPIFLGAVNLLYPGVVYR
ncbi:MAG TPA: site-2 protease family protein [Gemmatimonadales bacterium]|nr:site-2 protease family protein [Gemmatimonadales bacterium]